MSKIGIIDYGAGNIASVIKAIEYAGGDASLVSCPDQILSCDRLVLPGVGAAGMAMENLKKLNLDQALEEAVFTKATPIMGICVGMQLMAEDLYEFGHHKGLGWIKGRVVPLRSLGVEDRPVPHMGWSDVRFSESLKKLESRLGRHKSFYFAHSFALDTPGNEDVNSTVHYGRELTAGVMRDNIAAFQFHPEKSQISGDVLMQWFLDWSP
ncbi:MAG: imidazole glycerol phosphate synthase subunit HisH [Alphaproteobacteria bacterium]|nr:imidazole glycerol phosphate synthase subunit HisH [Alphaproteobacteria bacterium]